MIHFKIQDFKYPVSSTSTLKSESYKNKLKYTNICLLVYTCVYTHTYATMIFNSKNKRNHLNIY